MPILPGFFLSKPKPVGSGTIQIKSRVPWLPCTCIRPSLIGHSNKNNSAYKPSTTAEAPDGVLVVVLGGDAEGVPSDPLLHLLHLFEDLDVEGYQQQEGHDNLVGNSIDFKYLAPKLGSIL